MNGFSERTVAAASLSLGDRVVWWGETFRTVESIEPMGDGTDHLRVTYKHAPSARYAARSLVRVLEIAPVDLPASPVLRGDGLCWTDV